MASGDATALGVRGRRARLCSACAASASSPATAAETARRPTGRRGTSSSARRWRSPSTSSSYSTTSTPTPTPAPHPYRHHPSPHRTLSLVSTASPPTSSPNRMQPLPLTTRIPLLCAPHMFPPLRRARTLRRRDLSLYSAAVIVSQAGVSVDITMVKGLERMAIEQRQRRGTAMTALMASHLSSADKHHSRPSHAPHRTAEVRTARLHGCGCCECHRSPQSLWLLLTQAGTAAAAAATPGSIA